MLDVGESAASACRRCHRRPCSLPHCPSRHGNEPKPPRFPCRRHGERTERERNGERNAPKTAPVFADAVTTRVRRPLLLPPKRERNGTERSTLLQPCHHSTPPRWTAPADNKQRAPRSSAAPEFLLPLAHSLRVSLPHLPFLATPTSNQSIHLPCRSPSSSSLSSRGRKEKNRAEQRELNSADARIGTACASICLPTEAPDWWRRRVRPARPDVQVGDYFTVDAHQSSNPLCGVVA